MTEINLRVELGLNAQKIIQEVRLHNASTEELIARSIEKALDSLTSDATLQEQIDRLVRQGIINMVTSFTNSFEFNNLIREQLKAAVVSNGDAIAALIVKSMSSKLE
jgi:glutamate-1-semialdehyde aminotransferase